MTAHPRAKEITFDIEEWRDCVEFPDRYQVSNIGNVRSKSYLKTGANIHGTFSFLTTPKPIALATNPDGYIQVRLAVDGLKYSRTVHRMVAQAFISNPDSLPCVNHKNCNRSDNRVENLEWCTNQYNIQYGYDTGNNSNAGEKHPSSILNVEKVLEIKSLEILGFSCSDIASQIGLKYHTVYKVLKRSNWREHEPEGSKWSSKTTKS